MGTYELWATDGSLVGVYLDPVAAEDAAYRREGTSITYSAPSLDSRGGGGRCIDIPIPVTL